MSVVQASAATKKASSSTKHPSSKSASSSSTSKGKVSSSGKSKHTSTQARSTKPAGPPRQSTPTQERYSQIQQALAERGYYDGAADGVWNAASVDALRRFQTDQNLEPDGKLGALSLIALGLGPKRTPLQLSSGEGGGNSSLPPTQQQYLGKPEPYTDAAR